MTLDSISCTTCSAGYYCGGNGWVMPCGTGTYAEGGARECTVCPRNHYCTTTAKNPCPQKTYSPERSTTLAQCVPLTCPGGQIDIDGRCTGCPAGKITPPFGAGFTSLSDCLTCPEGTTPVTVLLVPKYIREYGNTACMYPCPADALYTTSDGAGCSFRSPDSTYGITGRGRDMAVPTWGRGVSWTTYSSTDLGYIPFST